MIFDKNKISSYTDEELLSFYRQEELESKRLQVLQLATKV